MKIYKIEQKAPQKGRLKEGEEKVLKTLFEFENQDEDIIFVDAIAQTLGMPKDVARHHCDVLFDAGMINWSGIDSCYLLPLGRSYVMDNLS